ncbi:unnamed protein product [Rotaria magnacalcarata]|uniref:Uncharacterized protein n=1 Tax=Rotaria magnacalcarata TaxID=392030 RepID=A0A816EGM0_9BILA|nr:unnamed protein product [Rotaria magnacalcarata]CAF1649586.1 unnamed protein product [Rotaria magnacalcarata]CAF2111913.1 unnamed protein product [Rotaria magnacalcarata]
MKPIDLLWKSSWPYVIANIIAVVLLLLSIVLIALKIAFVAKAGVVNTNSTYNSAVGIWCGSVIILPAITILVVNCM